MQQGGSVTECANSLYLGSVVHKRLRPVRHALSYRVFCVFLDCDALEEASQTHRLFSYNKFNLFSLYDRDHGDGTPISSYLAHVVKASGHGDDIKRFMMLCYPRILGYGFNPITVYYGLDANDTVRLMIYEVNNTFGHRKSYVLPVATSNHGLIAQACDKSLYVSPFNTDTGRYQFRVTLPQEDLTIGVALRTELGPTMKAHFHGLRLDFSDKNLLRVVMKTGWMTLTVTAAIHFEALKLWWKGLKIKPRPEPPTEPIAFPSHSD